MARPREFDPTQVLDDAMNLFWTQGYEATSISHLTAHTGINRASLYGTFGNKRSLFLSAVRRYHDRVHLELVRLLDSPGSPILAIRRTLEKVGEDAMDAAGRRGCLLTNSVVELACQDDEIMTIVGKSFRLLFQAFEMAIARGQTAGDISRKHSSRRLARFLLGTVQGLCVIGKTGPDRTEIQDITETALFVLEA